MSENSSTAFDFDFAHRLRGIVEAGIDVLVPIQRPESFADICKAQSGLEESIAEVIDRPLAQLDPVELSILLIGVFELQYRSDIPYRVVINEGVNLAKRFGALDGHKYINACLDNAAQSMREIEIKGSG